MYCYGHRSNKYLLVNYGFCFQDNAQDSFEFYLKTILSGFTPEHIVTLKPMSRKKLKLAPVQVVRLKTD